MWLTAAVLSLSLLAPSAVLGQQAAPPLPLCEPSFLPRWHLARTPLLGGHAYPYYSLVGGQYLNEGEADVVRPRGGDFEVVAPVGTTRVVGVAIAMSALRHRARE